MKSWIMKLWLRTHNEEEWPDLSVSQGIDVPHVLGGDSHPSEGNIEKMCSEEFYAQHRYKYVESSDVYGPKKRFEKSVPSDSPPYENISQVGEANESDYFCPATEKKNQTDDVLYANVHYKKWIKENQNAIYANERSCEDEPLYDDVRKRGINLSRLELGGDNEFNNHKWERARHTAHTANKGTDADENCEIHAGKEEAFIPKGSIRKHGSDQEVRMGKEETEISQSSHPTKKAKWQPESEEDVYNCAIATSGDSEEESMITNREEKKENASLEEASNEEPNYLLEGTPPDSGAPNDQNGCGSPHSSLTTSN